MGQRMCPATWRSMPGRHLKEDDKSWWEISKQEVVMPVLVSISRCSVMYTGEDIEV